MFLPCYPMCEDDKQAFRQLHKNFAQKQSSVKEDRHVATFSQEIQSIINFIERRFDGKEARAINAGFSFNGTFICINTRQLKNFISRCKSSINSSLQQLGYTSLKNKAKSHECLVSCLPCLANDHETARQWTVRYSLRRIMNPFVMYQQLLMKIQPPIYQQPPTINQEPKQQEQPLVRKPMILPMVQLPEKKEELQNDPEPYFVPSSPSDANDSDESCPLSLLSFEDCTQPLVDRLPYDWDFSISSYW